MNEKQPVAAIYDQLAEEYGRRFCNELDHKPFDRSLLRRFARSLPQARRILDLGCGPGHVAAFLHALGCSARGMDLSSAMVAEAKKRYPSLEYAVGDMFDLDLPDESLDAVVALYSIIHVPREELADVFREFFRVVRPGGAALVSFHEGEGILRERDVLDSGLEFECTLFSAPEVETAFAAAGFAVQESTRRRPYETEYPTTRVYVWAAKDAP